MAGDGNTKHSVTQGGLRTYMLWRRVGAGTAHCVAGGAALSHPRSVVGWLELDCDWSCGVVLSRKVAGAGEFGGEVMEGAWTEWCFESWVT